MNPVEAAFCHFDGADLRLSADGDEQPLTHLPHVFVFPSGRRCSSYDDLARGCLEEWEAARALLTRGALAQFLAASGRIDLAQKARPQTDADVALDAFIRALPARSPPGPCLDLQPRRLVLGRMRAGDSRQVLLAISNTGHGLLQGELIAIGSDWIRLSGSDDGMRLPLKLLRRQTVSVRVDTHGLPALSSCLGRLVVLTNGGIVEVPVSVEVEPWPFAHGPFQGVDRPRMMAERMRASPQEAVQALESGGVETWFAANSWTYPVEGPPARGVGAVQQFFEAMGLARPPVVTLREAIVSLRCITPAPCPGRITIKTTARKWVYGIAESDVSWLRLPQASASGPQRAEILFVVDPAQLELGEHHGTVRIRTNGGRVLEACVRVVLGRAREPLRRRLLRPALVGALAALVLRLLLAGPGDLYARVLARALAPGAASAPLPGSARDWLLTLLVDTRGGEDVPAGSLATWLQSPLADVEFVRNFALAMGWLGAAATAFRLWRRGTRGPDLGFAAVAGTVAALASSASLACVLVLLDGLPRLLLSRLARWGIARLLPDVAWVWTPMWILTAAVCWGFFGAAAGLGLGIAGARGRAVLARVERLLARFFRRLGLGRGALATS